ncbi:hypothetical protein SNEBB_005011 [Seison nebaliae]|nr:hypothetical protein SNEBB_005011 [Seison nebaliae]
MFDNNSEQNHGQSPIYYGNRLGAAGGPLHMVDRPDSINRNTDIFTGTIDGAPFVYQPYGDYAPSKLIATNSGNNTNINNNSNNNPEVWGYLVSSEKEPEVDEFRQIIEEKANEQTDVQEKTFTRWINAQLQRGAKNGEEVDFVKNFSTDLRDGKILLKLLEILSGIPMRPERGTMRVHKLNNVNNVLEFINEQGVKLVNISADNVVDGNQKLTLGLVWSIINQWQVREALKELSRVFAAEGKNLDPDKHGEKIFLNWSQRATEGYGTPVRDFTKSWRDGLAFNALIHKQNPNLFEWKMVEKMDMPTRLHHAFDVAEKEFGVEKLLDVEDVLTDLPDKKSIIMYLTRFYQCIPEDDPSKKPVSKEKQQKNPDEDISFADHIIKVNEKMPQQQIPSAPLKRTTGIRVSRAFSSDSRETMPNAIIDLSTYKKHLAEVFKWLKQVDSRLQQSNSLNLPACTPNDLKYVKDQFQSHEDFMLELTRHQSKVGKVLHEGTLLIRGTGDGDDVARSSTLPENVENEIRSGMKDLNNEWEELRVKAMNRQSDLHNLLTKLQNAKLESLEDWLNETEKYIASPKLQSYGNNLEQAYEYKTRLKELQDSIRHEQEEVNCLQHMIVVVDENVPDNAYAALENRLISLSDRWANVCKFVEWRTQQLAQLLQKWERLNQQHEKLTQWLKFREEELEKLIESCDFGSAQNVLRSIRQIQALEQELEEKRPVFDEVCLTIDWLKTPLQSSPAALAQIGHDQDAITNRWNKFVSTLDAFAKRLQSTDIPLITNEQNKFDNLPETTTQLLRQFESMHKELQEKMDKIETRLQTTTNNDELNDICEEFRQQVKPPHSRFQVLGRTLIDELRENHAPTEETEGKLKEVGEKFAILSELINKIQAQRYEGYYYFGPFSIFLTSFTIMIE